MQTNIGKLIIKHENQIQAFIMKRLEAEQGLLRQEKELLEKHHCNYRTASYDVWQSIEELRREHYKYWGNEGKLILALLQRQSAELQKAIDTIR